MKGNKVMLVPQALVSRLMKLTWVGVVLELGGKQLHANLITCNFGKFNK